MNVHCSMIVGLLVVALAPATQTPTAESIVAEMAARYAKLQSYQDSGVVLSHHPDKGSPDQTLFKTYFMRPEHFRFEWISHHPYPPLRHLTNFQVVWSNSSGAYTFWDSKGKIEPEESLALAVAGATGVSMGSAHTVPALLTDAIGGFTLKGLQSLTLVGEAEFEGVRCYHIKGAHPNGAPYELWIGKDDLLLRKLLTGGFPSGGTWEEIHRDIRIDATIPETVFHFEPGKSQTE